MFGHVQLKERSYSYVVECQADGGSPCFYSDLRYWDNIKINN